MTIGQDLFNHVVAYLAGWMAAQFALIGWWGMRQKRDCTPVEYYRHKWGEAMVSASFGLVGSLAWAEGSLARFIDANIHSFRVEPTLGAALAAGFCWTFFACSILRYIAWRSERRMEEK